MPSLQRNDVHTSVGLPNSSVCTFTTRGVISLCYNLASAIANALQSLCEEEPRLLVETRTCACHYSFVQSVPHRYITHQQTSSISELTSFLASIRPQRGSRSASLITVVASDAQALTLAFLSSRLQTRLIKSTSRAVHVQSERGLNIDHPGVSRRTLATDYLITHLSRFRLLLHGLG